MVAIIDRRNKALGGQANNRRESAITHIAWHYTAVARRSRAFITGHENYWRNTLGWHRGGYHYYIDADGKVYQNYNLTTVSNGVGGNNSYTVHISVEANSASDYSQAQINARQELTLMLMKRLNIPASRVMQHKEYPKASTSCAGYSKTQMDAFRRQLAAGGGGTTTVKPPASSGGSIVEYMVANGMDSSYSNRAKLAKQHGIGGYRGTASQNMQLLDKLKSSKNVKTGWIKNNTGWWYQNTNGSYPKNDWQYINKKWYLFDKHGYMLKGWQKVKDNWYYMDNSGAMQTGWQYINKVWYYLNASGAMQTGWIKPSASWYYLDTNGAMATGWKKVSDTWYYLNSSGRMQVGLITVGGKNYYLQRDGALITDEVIAFEANKHGHLNKQ